MKLPLLYLYSEECFLDIFFCPVLLPIHWDDDGAQVETFLKVPVKVIPLYMYTKMIYCAKFMLRKNEQTRRREVILLVLRALIGTLSSRVYSKFLDLECFCPLGGYRR